MENWHRDVDRILNYTVQQDFATWIEFINSCNLYDIKSKFGHRIVLACHNFDKNNILKKEYVGNI